MPQIVEASRPIVAFSKVAKLPQEALQGVLTAMECPSVDVAARARLHRLLELYGAERVTLVIRTITESEGNENALLEPVISAVSMVIGSNPEWPARGLQWLEAFDQIQLADMLGVMRLLDLFSERSLAHHFAVALRNTLRKIFAEMDAPAPVELPNRTNHALLAIEQGLGLLKHKGPHSNSQISGLAYDLYGLNVAQCAKVIKAARLYGDRASLVEKLTKNALFVLCSPSTPQAVREAVEQRLRAGERVTGPEIRRLRAQA